MNTKPHRRHSSSHASVAATALLICTFAAAPALAVEKHWNTGTGLWGLSTNWAPNGVPQPADLVYLDFFSGAPGTAVVNTNMGSPNSISVLNDNTIRMANFGSLGAGGDFIVGRDNTGGTLNLLNPNPVQAYTANITVGNTMRLGMFSGHGAVNQNGGVVNVNTLLRVGDRQQPGSAFKGVGTYNLSGVGVVNANRLEIGYGGDTQQFSFIEGTFNLSGFAVLNVHPGASIPDPKIGGGGAHGVFNQTGGPSAPRSASSTSRPTAGRALTTTAAAPSTCPASTSTTTTRPSTTSTATTSTSTRFR